nr:P-type conjugative transfer ATPase TrbB [uncultured bacterium]
MKKMHEIEDLEEQSKGKERQRKKLERDSGALIVDALNDPKTVELMCNGDGKLWLERLGEPMRQIGQLKPAQAESIIKTVAGYHGKEVTRQKPLLEGEWPLDGSRFAGQLPPVVRGATFAIRKKAIAIFTLDEYVKAGIMSDAQCAAIKNAIREHRNILVIGGTGSGKTTLVNAVINEMVSEFPAERVFIIEDTGEIQCAASNFVQYHTTIEVTMTMLLKTTLRMRPDRILVGEVRGEEALDLLDAWNTGHPGGAATLHANSAAEGLTRLKSLVSRNKSAPAEIEPLIGEAVHVVVSIARTPDGRRIQEILEVSGYADGRYQTRNL